MGRALLMAVVVLGLAKGAGADEVVLTARAGSLQGMAVGITGVAGGSLCFLGCGDDSAGLVVDAEAGGSGVKVGAGLGFAERTRDSVDLLALKAAVLTTWRNPLLGAADATYAGGELDVAMGKGVSIGALKRLGGPGWRLSLAFVHAF